MQPCRRLGYLHQFLSLKDREKDSQMESVIMEIRAAEGGDDSKLLVEDMISVYRKSANVLDCL